MTLNVVQGRSLAAMPDQGDKAEEPAAATSCEKQPVQKNLKKKDPASRSGKRRPFPVDAATAPAAINVEDGAAGIRRQLPPVDAAADGAAGIRRQLPPVDAAAEATSKKEDPSNLTVDVDDDLSDVSDIQELTAEEELLKAVGLDESK